MNTPANAASRFGTAWLLLCAALALHVTDEALTGFLDIYNPTVQAIRQRAPFLPLPTFTFRVWLTGLIVVVTLLSALSVAAFRGKTWMVPLAYVFGFFMLLNGCAHIAGSFYLGRLAPGVYSSPLLLAGAINLLVAARRARTQGSGS
jgi:uncharacterized membrane protein HdeD (DUF308 family)